MRFLVVGAGSIGKRHIRCLMELGQEVAACDTSPERLEDIEGTPGIKCYQGLDEALEGGCDAALVCTPTRTHLELAKKAALKGLHLFIEKPISDGLDGIDELVNLAGEKKLRTLVGCNARFYRPLIRVKEHIEKGGIGRVLSVRASIGFYLPYWHPGEDYTRSYSANQSLGGGVILDDIHELDYLRWILGEAREVYCVAVNTGALKIDTEDLASMIMTFESGVVAEVHFDYLQRTYRRKAEFIGDKGLAVCDFIRQKTDFYGEEVYLCRTKSEGLNADINHMYMDQMRHFIRCIDGGEAPVNDIASAKKTLELALAAKESARTGMTVRLGVI